MLGHGDGGGGAAEGLFQLLHQNPMWIAHAEWQAGILETRK